MSDLVRSALAAAVEGRQLSYDEAEAAMGAVMDGLATPAQLAAFLVAIRMRGETVEELAGFATAMRARSVHVTAPDGAIDIVGTGGDGSNTFNISTAAAIVVAAAGVPVAKHGNRAVSSRAGSADVLEALGIRIDHDAASAAEALARDGFAFLFAPAFHPAMRHAGPTRRELGIRTAFNLLGPLTNPAGVRRGVVGSGEAATAAKLAAVLARLGTDRTLVVRGAGVDELPLDGSGIILDVTPAGITETRVERGAFGLAGAETSELRGGDAAENARTVEAILDGERGIRRDVVTLNAGAAFVAAGRAADLGEGIDLARETIDNGLARQRLERLRAGARSADQAAAMSGEAR